jgi:hypothetical protein
MIKDMIENQNSDRAGSVFMERASEIEEELESATSSYQFLSARDIYMRVAQNLELIELYSRVNQ